VGPKALFFNVIQVSYIVITVLERDDDNDDDDDDDDGDWWRWDVLGTFCSSTSIIVIIINN
jgi:hypothetical protein